MLTLMRYKHEGKYRRWRREHTCDRGLSTRSLTGAKSLTRVELESESDEEKKK